MIDQQLSQQNAMNQQIYGSSQALGSQAASGYQNLLANPGYSDTEKSAIANLSQSALSSSFDALAQNAANRAARTRNSAGYGELIDSLARTQGQDQANLAQQNQIAFANASRAGTLSALLRPLRALRHRHGPARPRTRHPRAVARRQRAQRSVQRIQLGFRPRRIVIRLEGVALNCRPHMHCTSLELLDSGMVRYLYCSVRLRAGISDP
jgi:hypothetical protein